MGKISPGKQTIGIMWAPCGIMGWNIAHVILGRACIIWNPLGQLPSFLLLDTENSVLAAHKFPAFLFHPSGYVDGPNPSALLHKL